MANISFFKKLRLFSFYKKIIKQNKVRLERELNIRIDSAYRLYTVLNIPEELYGEFTLKKSDIDKISENYIREYIFEVSKFLRSIGLNELFESYEVKKVDKYSYLLVIGFSLFRSNVFYNNLYYKFLPILGVASIIAYFFLKS
jgi:hypothetical protein